MPWVGMRGDGDYSLALGRRLDVRAGVGLVAPVVGPRLLAQAPDRERIDTVRAGMIGTVVHAGIGLKLR